MMKLKDIYSLAVKMGIENDPRGKTGPTKQLEKSKKAFAKLKGSEKDEFDQDRLSNPFADTRILKIGRASCRERVYVLV